MRKVFNKSNVINVLLGGLILVVLFVPSAKALMIQGLMKVGLFAPDTSIEHRKVTETEQTPVLAGIKFKDASGKELDLGDLKGKVIFLNFWATWCPPCLAEMPSVNKLYEQFKTDAEVVFIMVDADSDFPKAKKYMDRKGYQMPVYAVASRIPQQLFAGSLPTTVVLDKHGRISYHEVGAADYANKKFVDFIKQLKAD
ncbi:TlpA disulfide reductase family protein [Pedobacter sp. PLR]|uniref:TlpA family protein disulfide reductase n=1 Tax=Pedobacter sp. PLR TaxID=2994465 RepID=UPI0022484086|nr:TlpA disulfide reductase family protein [Pedobacter sp. PLR]MCX2452994.1 TlpA disulfide reductase family protein [Pedobacter sp. PLR]